jgi:hypothetical protein
MLSILIKSSDYEIVGKNGQPTKNDKALRMTNQQLRGSYDDIFNGP